MCLCHVFCDVDVVEICALPPVVSPKRKTGGRQFVQSTLCIKYGIWGGGSKKQSYWSLRSPRRETKTESSTGRLTRAQMQDLRDRDYDDRVQIIKAKQRESVYFRYQLYSMMCGVF